MDQRLSAYDAEENVVQLPAHTWGSDTLFKSQQVTDSCRQTYT